MKYVIAIFCALTVFLAYAAHSAQRNHQILSKGIVLKSFQACKQSIHRCPVNGSVYADTCVERVLTSYGACNQLRYISKTLNARADTLFLTHHGKLSILERRSIADGQYQYYIITPNGQMIDTTQLPKNALTTLKKVHSGQPLMLSNWQEPKYNTLPEQEIITVPLRISAGCISCKTLGYVFADFVFDKDGIFKKITLTESAH